MEEQIDAESLKRGNCIPLAMARLLPAKKAQILQALTASNHKNAEAEQSGSRCYNFLLKEMSIWAAPRLGLDTSKPGNYLLHMEDKGTPHCIACRVRDNELVELWDGLHKTRLLLPELVQLSEEAVDSNTIVTFQLFENDVEREPSHTKERSAAAVLLQMRAEAGEADEEWQSSFQNPCECSGPWKAPMMSVISEVQRTRSQWCVPEIICSPCFVKKCSSSSRQSARSSESVRSVPFEASIGRPE